MVKASYGSPNAAVIDYCPFSYLYSADSSLRHMAVLADLEPEYPSGYPWVTVFEDSSSGWEEVGDGAGGAHIMLPADEGYINVLSGRCEPSSRSAVVQVEGVGLKTRTVRQWCIFAWYGKLAPSPYSPSLEVHEYE